jgi:hypothetical protein
MGMAMHYNMALLPERTILPACRLMAPGRDKAACTIQATTDKEQVTCRRCLQALKIKPRRRARRTA